MRVIAGKYKGRQLKCPKGLAIRPAPDRLKEALFNILQHQMDGAVVLDVCAGTGAMGIEALSRGAHRVMFVDSWPPAVEVLRENLRHCGVDSNYHILRRDALVALKHLTSEGARFDLVFFDPPYASELYESVMAVLGEGSLLHPDGLVIVMHHSKKTLAEEYGDTHRVRTVKQGENVLSFYALA